MKFGVVTDLSNVFLLHSQGWDYIEVNIQKAFDGTKSDDEWTGLTDLSELPIPALAGAQLLPPEMKIVGEEVDHHAIRNYLTNVMQRAGRIGTKIVAFGSGQARQVPDGFDPARAKRQIIDFFALAAPLARENGVTIATESLNRSQCNMLNSLNEVASIVREVDHVGVKQLYDSFHSWMEDESLAHLRTVGSLIRHVHLADRQNRAAPGLSGQSDYRAAFRILKEASYQGSISVEAKWDVENDGPRVLEFLKKQWSKA